MRDYDLENSGCQDGHLWEVKGDDDALYQECNDCGCTKDYDEWEVIATGFAY